MKYRIKFKPIIILVLICVLLLFRLSFVVTGDIDSSPEDLACAQENIGNLIDYIPVLLTFAITATLSLKNSRQNKASCIINVFAALCCFVAIVFQDGIAMWNAFGSYFSLAFMLLSFCVVPIHEDEMLKTDNAKDERSQSVRVILIALIIIMIALAVFSFFNGTPKYTVSNGIVYLFGLVILLLISDSIETFSIGSLFTLKKKVQEQAAEVSKLSQQNQELRTQMISVVSTSLSNRNLNYNLFDIHGLLNKAVNVEQASAEDVHKKEENESEHLLESRPHSNVEIIDRAQRQSYQSQFEDIALKKFLFQSGISNKELQREIRFSEQFIDADPIMERNIIFDAYIKRPLDELFIEIAAPSIGGAVDYRYYHMISKIYYYSKAINKSAKMLLILYRIPQSYQEKLWGNMANYRNPEVLSRRIKTVFAPAINNGLLEIAEIEITEEECVDIEKLIAKK